MKADRALRWCRENRTLTCMLVLEFVMLIWLLAISLGPLHQTVLKGTEIGWPGAAIADGMTGTVIFAPIEDTEQTDTYHATIDLSLPAGGYDMAVDYHVTESQIDKTLHAVGGKGTQLGVVQCGADGRSGTQLRASSVVLYSGNTRVVGRVWTTLTSKVENLTLDFLYYNNATVCIDSISIIEQPIYRVSRILGFLLAAILLDLFTFYLTDKNRDYRKKYALFGVIVIGVTVSLPLFADYLMKGTDLEYHLLRIGAVAEELKNGQFPVRIYTEAANGAGYLAPVFYSDFFLYIPAVLYLMMLPLQLCYQVYVVVVNVVTAAVSYNCFKEMFGSRKLGILGALLYTFAADRLVGIFASGAVGKYTALTFLPLIALGVYRIMESRGKVDFREYLPLVFGLTGIIQSHILTCVMIFMFGVLFFLFNIRKFLQRERLFGMVKAGLTTVLLNLFFLVPFLMSWMQDLNIKLESKDISIKDQGAYPVQLVALFSPLNGYFQQMRMQGDISMTMGVSLAMGGVVFALCMMRSREWKLEGDRAYTYGRQMLGYGVLALFLCTIYFPWELGGVSRVLSAIQFPARFLEIVTIIFTIISLCAVKILQKKEESYANGLVLLLAGITLVSVGYFYTFSAEQAAPYYVYTYEELDSMNLGGGAEYIPGIQVDVVMLINGSPVTESEDVKVSAYEKQGNLFMLRCANQGQETASVTLPLFCYDNYVVRDAGTHQPIAYEKDENSVMRIWLSAGYTGEIEIFYQPPAIWWVYEVMSLMAWISLVGYVVMKRMQTKRMQKKGG